MSHPYWPQPQYLFRPGGRQSQAPVPHSLGQDDYAGARYETVGTPAPRSLRRGNRTYGSMTPRHDWATPGYIREEPSGMGYFGEDAGCVGGAKTAIASYLAGKIKQSVGYPSSCPEMTDDFDGWTACRAKQALYTGAEVLIKSALGAALSAISGDLSDTGVQDQIYNAIAGKLPNISIPSLDINVSEILLPLIRSAIGAALSACDSALGAPAGVTTQLQQWCEKGYAFDSAGSPYPSEAGFPQGADLSAQCAGWGYQYNGPQFVDPGSQMMVGQIPKSLAAQREFLAQKGMSMQLLSTYKAEFKTNCEAGGGVVVQDLDPYTKTLRDFCQPNEAKKAACKAQGGVPAWDTVNGYRCLPAGSAAAKAAGAAGAAGGAGGIAMIAGVAALALLLFRR